MRSVICGCLAVLVGAHAGAPLRLAFLDADIARVVVASHLPVDVASLPLDPTPAYVLVEGDRRVRAALFVQETDTSQAVRLVRDPELAFEDKFHHFRRLLYKRERRLDVRRLSDSERLDFLYH